MKNMELCVEEAAVTGDYGLLMQAFILNPQTVSGQKMVNVLNELLIAHEKYLPQFADKIAELKAAGVTIKDDVARELTEKRFIKKAEAFFILWYTFIGDYYGRIFKNRTINKKRRNRGLTKQHRCYFWCWWCGWFCR